jgi:hypothetical protein
LASRSKLAELPRRRRSPVELLDGKLAEDVVVLPKREFLPLLKPPLKLLVGDGQLHLRYAVRCDTCSEKRMLATKQEVHPQTTAAAALPPLPPPTNN